MKTLSLFFSLLIVLAVSGCATVGPTLDQSKLASLTHIHIVPIEGLPLHAEDLKLPSSATQLISSTILFGGPIGLIANTAYLMSDSWKNLKQGTATAQDAVTFLNESGTWEPTVEIAGETKRHLEAVSNFSVSVAPEIKPVPGIKQTQILLASWKAPSRKWYNAETSSFDYSEQPSSGAILEIGLHNYMLAEKQLFVWIMMKLVNPRSGAVIAKAYCSSLLGEEYDDIGKLFENDASGFKKLFHEATAKRVPECIEDLGLARK